jgi:hypothetical protein
MASGLTQEIVEIAAAMQVKALLFDTCHPDNPLGTWSAASYAKAIQALTPAENRLELATLMVEANNKVMRLMLLAHADMSRPS